MLQRVEGMNGDEEPNLRGYTTLLVFDSEGKRKTGKRKTLATVKRDTTGMSVRDYRTVALDRKKGVLHGLEVVR